MSKVYAPWNDREVEALKRWQKSGIVHPFTCVCGQILVPTKASWVCEHCDYIQTWCHDFMIKERAPKCTYDPRLIPKDTPIGMFHCPECGEMVVAGIEHPDYGLLDMKEGENGKNA